MRKLTRYSRLSPPIQMCRNSGTGARCLGRSDLLPRAGPRINTKAGPSRISLQDWFPFAHLDGWHGPLAACRACLATRERSMLFTITVSGHSIITPPPCQSAHGACFCVLHCGRVVQLYIQYASIGTRAHSSDFATRTHSYVDMRSLDLLRLHAHS